MPSTSTDRLFGLTTSLAVKAPCVVATSANVTLAGLQTIQGIALAENDRVLVRAQTDPVDNGVYIASTSDWVRAADCDGQRDLRDGTMVLVRNASTEGIVYQFRCDDDPPVIGTSELTFSSFAHVSSIATGADALVNGVTVGKGQNTGNSHGTAVGVNALQTVAIGEDNTAVGWSAMQAYGGLRSTAVGSKAMLTATDAYQSVAVGFEALYLTDSADYNTAVGCLAMRSNVTGRECTAVGETALYSQVGGVENCAFGVQAGFWNLNGGQIAAFGYRALLNNTASENTAVGAFAGANVTSAADQVLIGYSAGSLNITGARMTAVGHEALLGATGDDNTAVGSSGMRACTTGTENTAIGQNALGDLTTGTKCSAIGRNSLVGVTNHTNCTGLGYAAPITNDNQVQLGNSATTTYAYGAVQDRSDARDKADVRDTVLGLEFILKLRAVDFRWDYREDYDWREKDGSKKRTRFHHGLIAQEVKATLDE